jgi:hypothetical protein
MKCYLSGMPDDLLAVVTALTRGSIPTEPELPVGEAAQPGCLGHPGSQPSGGGSGINRID